MEDASGRGEYRGIGVLPALYQVGENFRRGHGICHAPLVEARRNIEVWRPGTVLAHIGDPVQGHAVLGGPAAGDGCVGIVLGGKPLQFLPVSALLTCPVSAAPQNQGIPLTAEGQAVFRLVQIHSVKQGYIFQCKGIGTLLVQLQKIAAVLVEEGEVGGDDDLLRPDGAPVSDGGMFHQLTDGGVFVNMQVTGKGGQEFQGMEPGLPGEFYRTNSGEGKGQIFRQLRRKTQSFQGGQLTLQHRPVTAGVNIIVLLREIAVDVPAQLPIAIYSFLVGFQIQPGCLRSEPGQQLVKAQPMLRSDLGCGVFCDAAADLRRLRHQAVYPGLLQPVCA